MKIDVLNSLDKYEQWLAPARERFAASPGIRAIQASSDEVFLESFLLHFCALGTRMTEPVERWIRRAAERCAYMGLTDLSCLSFVRQHIELDAAHTRFNARSIAKLVELSPSRMSALVSAGAAALDAYAQFIDDCVQLAKRDSRKAGGSTPARPSSLSWQLRLPPAEATHREGSPSPSWLTHVRSLRGSVLFDNGSRPQFIARDGRFCDADPIDLHSHHILAYDGTKLVGCVRIYRLVPNGPACVSERIFGEKRFSAMLHELGVARTETVEIGRWIVHRTYRTTSRPSVQLAAASAALAMRLRRGVLAERRIVVCSVGTRDRQDSMLARIGLAPVPAMDPVDSDDFNDKVRMMYCNNTQQLPPRFLRMMDEMAKTLGLADALRETQAEPLQGASVHADSLG